MFENGTARQKSRQFSVRIVRLYQHLVGEKHEHVMAKQLLRCGTSIGANPAEADELRRMLSSSTKTLSEQVSRSR